MEKFVKQFESLIAASEKIAIVGHFNPDGDSVGSATGMKLFLKSINKRSTLILPSAPPSFLQFLGADEPYLIYSSSPNEVKSRVDEADLLICLDFNKLSRTEGMEPILREAKGKKVLIDHHIAPDREIFDLVYSNPPSSSTCELLFYILLETSFVKGDIGKFPRECAEALAVGLLTDTNQFKNSTTADTFKMASLLTQKGVALDRLGEKVFGAFREERMRLMGKMLRDEMVIIPELRASFMVLTKKIQKEYNYSPGDSEGFVNLPLSIEGVDVSALFTEGDEYIRVSLRSLDGFSVNRLSNRFFNGGGHERAAGGRLYIPIEEVPNYFKESLRAFKADEEV